MKVADLNRIYNAFKKADYLRVPSYYDRKTRKNTCRICGWENRNGHDVWCSNCTYRKTEEGRQGKKIRGIPVMSMNAEDYLIFRAIAEGKTEGIDFEVTIDEYAKEIKVRFEEGVRKAGEKARAQRQYEAVLFD